MQSVVNHLVFEGFDTADAHAEHHTHAGFVEGVKINAAVFHSLDGRNQCQLCVAVHLTCLFTVEIVVEVQVLYFAGKLCLEFGSVEQGEGTGATDAVDQVVPRFFGGVAHRSNGTKSRDYNSF